jgi:acetyltransferase-like isoleucine patch superfamily enzyme
MTLFKLFHSGVIRCKSYCYRLFWGHYFGSFGKGTVVVSPRIYNPQYIYIGERCSIEHFVWLLAVKPERGGVDTPRLVLEDEVKIGRLSEIATVSSVVLRKGARVADNVFISDNTHRYENANIPIQNQGFRKLNHVEIGEYSTVGRNVCIIGCTIGKHCVIGANSVVNRDIPDFSVVVGNPARIVKRYNPDTKQWEKTDKDGNFI